MPTSAHHTDYAQRPSWLGWQSYLSPILQTRASHIRLSRCTLRGQCTCKHVELGYEDDVTTHALLQCTLEGIRRSIGDVRRPRLPITINVLRHLKESLRSWEGLCDHDKVMLWASFTLAFFGFLRVSEFTAAGPLQFDPATTLLVQDIVLSSVLEMRLKSSKTDPYRRGYVLRIAPTGTSVCAVNAFAKYRRSHCLTNTEVPFFQFADGTWLTRQRLTHYLRKLLVHAGIKSAELYTTHSFRSGAATTAAEAGLPDWLIKTLGRWRSGSYQVYIKTAKAGFCASHACYKEVVSST
ncbi:uncharacterized protein [Ptychodera flava]|uniref:uncharacterized protein n=1 Tax=Ptychodera flava TaxID=63121 RepID=UPI00396A280F